MEHHLTQKCKKCQENLPISKFHKDKHTKTGLKYTCIDCSNKNKTEKKRSRELELIKTLKKDYEGEEEETEPPEKRQRITPEALGRVEIGKVNIEDLQVQTDYPEFDIVSKMEPGEHYAVILVGPRRSGKTTWISYIWSFLKTRYHIIYFFTNSSNAAIYKTFLDEKDLEFMFEEFDASILEDIERFQRLTEGALDICIFFDDMSSHKNKNADGFLQYWIRGRNINASIFFSTQSRTFLNPDERANADFAFIFDPKNPEMKTKIIDTFLMNSIPTPVECTSKSKKYTFLNKWLRENTQNHGIRVLDYTDPVNFVWKFTVPKDFAVESTNEIKTIKAKVKKIPLPTC
jgi:GTPase SAR1 family protein